MIVTKCPLRISLAGGSTDLQSYLEKYGTGSVVSFTPNLFTYIVLKKSSTKYYKIVYSRIEKVLALDKIQNDVAREVLKYFKIPPVEVIFTADIPSTGSGLASSSSYLISLIKACLEFTDKQMSELEIGELAIKLERNFNPLTGYQDIYGCIYSGFKRLDFNKKGLVQLTRLPDTIFKEYSFCLVPVGNIRNSTDILSTLNLEEIHKLSVLTEDTVDAIIRNDYIKVCRIIKEGWYLKKITSPYIVGENVKITEELISKIPNVAAWRLIGAGNGGYFLVVVEKKYSLPLTNIPIELYA